MAFAVAGRLEPVDRVDEVAGAEQGLDPRAAVGLDPDHHPIRLAILGEVIGHHCVQRGAPSHTLGQPASRETVTVVVDDLNVVMIFSPVVTDEQHR